MKDLTRKVTLYVDLPAGWQDRPQDEWFFTATPKPYSQTMQGDLRVAIEVDLPYNETVYRADRIMQARYIEPIPIAKIPKSE